MTAIRITPIETSISICCPWCGYPLDSVTAAGFSAQTPWMQDGDALPAFSRPNRADIGHDDMLYQGRCFGCEKNFYVLEISRLLASQDSMDRAIQEDAEATLVRISQCLVEDAPTGVPAQWLHMDQRQGGVPLHVHFFGPFPLPDLSLVSGTHGVSPCQGRGGNIVWQGAVNLVMNLEPAIELLLRSSAEMVDAPEMVHG